MDGIKEAIEEIRGRIETACRSTDRSPSDVKLIGVTKGVDIERIRRAASSGITDFGENYVQEATKKIEGFDEEVCWHMIGHIQTNKIKYIQRLFGYVHSIDKWEQLEGFEKYEKELKIFFELNLSGELSKFGTTEDNLRKMLERIHTLKYVQPAGLMTMAPLFEDPAQARPLFGGLREVLQRMNREFGLEMKELSMGMSSDFEVAIEEGATMVRIGTAIFGARA
jgi:pyridoxal phosphate enzyme (YggS family)